MKPTDYAVLHAIRARAARCRLGYAGRAWVTSDPKSEVVEDRMWLLEYIDQEARATNRLREQLQIAADSFRNLGCAVDADDCEEVIKESLSGGNPGEPKACTPAEERGIAGATGAGQLPDGNGESIRDSAERRSPDDTTGPSSPDESNRHFERGCFVIMELMQAYERRVRSDCTPEQLEKRPWECAEYLKAAEYLRKVWPPHEPLKPCGWAYDEDGIWQTDCGESFVLMDGTPEDNDFRFCCYCGKNLPHWNQVTKSGDAT